MGKHSKFLVTVALFWFSQYVFIPFFTPHLTGLGIASTTAGLILGAYGFSQMLLRIPFGLAANRSGDHKAFMLFGFCCITAAGLILFFAGHPAAFLIARLLAGVASATWVSFTVFFTGLYPAGDTGKAIGTVMAANNLGTLLSYLFGIFFFNRMGGIGAMFAVSVVVGILGFALLLTVKDDRGRGAGGMTLRDFADVLKNRGLMLHSALAALMQLIAFATVITFTANYAKQLGAGGSELAFLSVLTGASGVAGSYWLRTRWCARVPNKIQLAASFALTAAYCLVVPNTGSMALIFVMQLIGGLGVAIAMAQTMALALGGVPLSARSAAMGVYQCIYGLGMTFGPIVMGGLIDLSGQFTIACYGIAAVCAAGFAWSLFAVRAKTDGAGR
ncbi:MAG: MFS transporter [Clostridiales bacterium]|nr:MFS transporter [Clostridiales bacterium]